MVSEVGSIKYLWVALGRLNTTLTAIFHDEYNLTKSLQYKSHRWEP